MNVIMPQMGETVEEGTIVKWLKKVGDTVSTEDIILEIETDKVGMDVPAPADGILSMIHIQEGATVAVGTILAEVSTVSDSAAVDTDTSSTTGDTESRDDKSLMMDTLILDLKTSSEVTKPNEFDSEGPLSPVVRKLLSENKLDPSKIIGTGRDGRIKRDDVLDNIQVNAAMDEAVAEVEELVTESSKVVAFSKLRKKTAEHMVLSKAVSPHVLQAVEVDFHRVDQARLKYAEAWKADKGFSLTYLPFIARALCVVLPDFPELNASVEGENLRLHTGINLGIAVNIEMQGLMVPVIKNAEQKNLAEISKSIHDLARRARENQLNADDLTEGTYTISNPGGYGTFFTAPIIAQPQVAILSTDGVKKRPVVIEGPEGDSIAIRPVGILAQSFDHRAVDGAYSAAFLQHLKTVLENSDWDKELSQVGNSLETL